MYCIKALRYRELNKHWSDLLKHMLYAKLLHDEQWIDGDTTASALSKQISALRDRTTADRKRMHDLKQTTTKINDTNRNLSAQYADLCKRIDALETTTCKQNYELTQANTALRNEISKLRAQMGTNDFVCQAQICELSVRMTEMCNANAALQKQVSQLIDSSSATIADRDIHADVTSSSHTTHDKSKEPVTTHEDDWLTCFLSTR